MRKGLIHKALSGPKTRSRQYESGQLSSKNTAPKHSKAAKGKGVFAY